MLAERIETEIHAAFLRLRRCEDVQGYLIGKPVPPDEFEKSYDAAKSVS